MSATSPFAMRWSPPETEVAARVELAAAYQIAAKLGWGDLSATHFSMRVPDEPDAFLLLALGAFFEEVTPENLVKVGIGGEIRSDAAIAVSPAGVTIHAAILGANDEVNAILHTHSPAGVAVANHPDGLLPLSQHALRFYENQGIHEYEGVALDDEEGPRLAGALAGYELLLLRNHGLLTAGPTMPLAFSAMYYAEAACRMQIDTLASVEQPVEPDEATCRRTREQYVESTGYAYRDWLGLVRRGVR
jgi:ribulose-5-phosphate 4-epimerase/fuculose-1-phosphate aldolase